MRLLPDVALIRCEHCSDVLRWAYTYGAANSEAWIDRRFDRLLKAFQRRHLPCRLAAKARLAR